MYGAPCPLCGGAGLLRALTATLPCHALKLVRIETDAVWRLSRCSLVLCFSLEGTRACADTCGYRVRVGCRLRPSALFGA